MRRAEQRVYCWIRQQRYLIAVYKYIYYFCDEQMLDDSQYDYLKKRLEIVESRWAEVAHNVTNKSYTPPRFFADVILHRSVEGRAHAMLRRWIRNGRPVIGHIFILKDDISELEIYRDALHTIVRYPIEHL